MRELDDRIVRHVVSNFGPRPDKPIEIEYLAVDKFSVFQVLPLVLNIRRLTTRSRPLRATDLNLANEEGATDDHQPFVIPQLFFLLRDSIFFFFNDLSPSETYLFPPPSALPI